MSKEVGTNLKYFLSFTLFRLLFLNGCLGLGGILLISYELSADYLGLRETKIDTAATFLGALFTLVGVLVTAMSIYAPARAATKPARESYFTAPIVIVLCLVAGGFLFVNRDLPSNIVNGFALIGLAGALFRIQPNPQRAAETVESSSLGEQSDERS